MLETGAPEKDAESQKRRPQKQDSELVSIPYFYLDLKSKHVDLFGQRHWELRSPYRHNKRPLNTGVAPRKPLRASLSNILEVAPALKYYLSKTACIGILRRAFEQRTAEEAGACAEDSSGAHAAGRSAYRPEGISCQPAGRGHRPTRCVWCFDGDQQYADADLCDAAG